MIAARAALLAAGVLLAACTTPPQPGAGAESPGHLMPLATALAVPPGMAPRSQVPRVNYELSASGDADLPPDDGVPGDPGPRDVFERGGASWYGIQFHQRKTANGERFDMMAMTAAHKTLPFGTLVCVRSLVNGREVLVRINDRGPYAQGRIIDLSRAAADEIGLTSLGIKQVALSVIDRKEQRCGGVAGNLEALEPAKEDAAPTGKVPRGISGSAGKAGVNPRQRR